MKKNSTDFADTVTNFLLDYLPYQRSYSANTVISYRDSLKLLLRFIVDQKSIPVYKFYLKDLDRNLVIEFLEWYRQNGSSNTTANQRLAAIKTFCEYAQSEHIEYISQFQKIISIKSKKSKGREISYLSVDQISKLINYPDINTYSGCRHKTAMAVLYDSGARAQELCDVTIGDITTDNITTIKLHGKGNKHRTVVISEETGRLLRYYIDTYRSRALKTDPLVLNRYGHRIERDGLSYIIQKYTSLVIRDDPDFPSKVHCHMFRHSKACICWQLE